VAYVDLVAEVLDVEPRTMLSVDVEDYFHAISGGVEEYERHGLPSNLERNVDTLLDLFAEHGVPATFFVLSSTLQRIRTQLARMLAEGHELASHGHAHLRATKVSPREFGEDIARAKGLIEDAVGKEVRGFRAPYFAVCEGNLWAVDAIREAGYVYDSSVAPVRNFAYGVPTAPEQPHRLANGLLEVPMPQKRLLGYRCMVGGGFYLRLYPFWLTRLLLRLRDPALPRVLYIHPWEWEDPRLNLWDLVPDLPGLRWRRRQRKFIATYNRHGALDRFARLVALTRPGVTIASALGL
jgi:polysaccharide deacetylase family protein (PEP-CTERM system associated)